jgi:hypothetical protein
MTEPFEPILKKAFKNIETQKTTACIDIRILGLYIQGRLPKEEMVRTEEHIGSCLYCLNQVVELKELLFLQRHGAPLSSHVLGNIRALLPKKPAPEKKTLKEVFSSSIQTIYNFFTVPLRQWRYATVPIAAAAALIFIYVLLNHLIFSPEKPRGMAKIPGERDSTYPLGFSSDRPPKIDKTPEERADAILALKEAKTPIILEAQNIDRAFERVRKVIQSHNGKLIDFFWMENEMGVIFTVKLREETQLLNELAELGRLKVEREGYRDKKGNIVLFLKEKKR